MAKDPAFPLYYSDWLGSTRIAMMDAHQERGYLRLLCHLWADKDCSLPDDDQLLARLSLMGEKWFDGGSRLIRECFTNHPTKTGFITNTKLFELRKEREEWREKSSLGGRKSVESRRKSGKLKPNDKPPFKPINEPPIEAFVNSPSPSSSPSSSSLPLPSPPPFSVSGAPPLIPIPDGLNTPEFLKAWSTWLEYLIERNHRHPTQATLMRQLAELSKRDVGNAIELLDEAIRQGWAAPVWDDKKPKHDPNDPLGNLATRERLHRQIDKEGDSPSELFG